MDVTSVASGVVVSPAGVVDVDAAAVVEVVAPGVVEVVVSPADVEDDVASSEVEVASSEVEVASSVVDGEPGVLGVVVAGGPLDCAGVVLGLVDGVVSTSVGGV